MTVFGIDISKYQTITDYSLAAEQIKYVWMRSSLGYGTDYKLDLHYNGFEGTPRGLYHVVWNSSEAPANGQLAHMLNLCELYPAELPLMLDVERQDVGFSITEYLAKGYYDKYGEYPPIYTSPGWWNNRWARLTQAERDSYWKTFGKCDLWAAHYYEEYPDPIDDWDEPTLHQFSESGRLDGIQGSVDFNNFFGTYQEFLDKYNLDGAQPSKYVRIKDFNFPKRSFLLFRSYPTKYAADDIFALGNGAVLEIAGEPIKSDITWLPVRYPIGYSEGVGYISANDYYIEYL